MIHVDPDHRRCRPTRPDPRRLYELAESQHGFFTAAQARSAGYSHALLSHHARRGRFRRVSRGLYRLRDYPPHPHAALFRAWLEAGGRDTDALVSHESALFLHGVLEAPWELEGSDSGRVDVTVPRSARWVRTPSWVRIHPLREHVPSAERDEVADLPVTSLLRSLVDVAAREVPEDRLGLVLRRIRYEKRAGPMEIHEAARQRGPTAVTALGRAHETVPYGFRGPEEPLPPRDRRPAHWRRWR